MSVKYWQTKGGDAHEDDCHEGEQNHDIPLLFGRFCGPACRSGFRNVCLLLL